MTNIASAPSPPGLSAENLLRLPLFQGLSIETARQVRSLLSLKRVKAGAELIHAGSAAARVFIVVSGTLRVCAIEASQRAVTLCFLGAGEVVGEIGALDCLGRSASVRAEEECWLLKIEAPAFQEMMRAHPVLAHNLTLMLCRRIRLANARILTLSAQDVSGRLARALLLFAEEYGEKRADGSVKLPFRLTQSDLANFIGASRVRVNHTLAFWKQQGYLSIEDRYRLVLRQLEPLQQRACDL